MHTLRDRDRVNLNKQLLQAQCTDSTDVIETDPVPGEHKKLNAESLRNLTTDKVMLSDRKRPKETPMKTKLFTRYDFFTGQMTQRKVQAALASTTRLEKEKSNYAKVAEARPYGFGRSQGIC